jgi:hypothetical protein
MYCYYNGLEAYVSLHARDIVLKHPDPDIKPWHVYIYTIVWSSDTDTRIFLGLGRP